MELHGCKLSMVLSNEAPSESHDGHLTRVTRGNQQRGPFRKIGDGVRCAREWHRVNTTFTDSVKELAIRRKLVEAGLAKLS